MVWISNGFSFLCMTHIGCGHQSVKVSIGKFEMNIILIQSDGMKIFKPCGHYIASIQSLMSTRYVHSCLLCTHAIPGPVKRFPSPTHSCSIDEVGHTCDEFVQQKGMKSLQLWKSQSYFCYTHMIHCFYGIYSKGTHKSCICFAC